MSAPTKDAERLSDAEYFRLAYCIQRGIEYRPLSVETEWHYWPRPAQPNREAET